MREEEIQEALAAAAGRYRLTPTEAIEARMVISGLSVKESASARGVEPGTVYKQRKHIYYKTDARSAGRLAALILGVPAVDARKADRAGAALAGEADGYDAHDDPPDPLEPMTRALKAERDRAAAAKARGGR